MLKILGLPMLMLFKNTLSRFINIVGSVAALCMLTLLLTIFYNVVMRYLFNDVSIGMQELEWHLFSCIFLFGIGYSLKDNAHVRVDVFYEHFSIRTQAIINIIGTLVFLIPFSSLVIYYGIQFSYDAFELNEMSGDPGGLPHRWLIKGAIPLSFSFTVLCGLYVVLEQFAIIFAPSNPHDSTSAS